MNPKSAIAIIALCFSLTSCSTLLASNDGRQLFPIVQNKKIGCMDKSGKVVINPQFDFGSNFSEGFGQSTSGGIGATLIQRISRDSKTKTVDAQTENVKLGFVEMKSTVRV